MFHLRHKIANLYAQHQGICEQPDLTDNTTKCLSSAIIWFESLLIQMDHLPPHEQPSMHAILTQQLHHTRAEIKLRPDAAYDKNSLKSEIKKNYEIAQALAVKVASSGTLLDKLRVAILTDYYHIFFGLNYGSYHERVKLLTRLPSNTECFFSYWRSKISTECIEYRRDLADRPEIHLTLEGKVKLENEFSSHMSIIAGQKKFNLTVENVFIRKGKELSIDHRGGKMDCPERRMAAIETAFLNSILTSYASGCFLDVYPYLVQLAKLYCMFQTSIYSPEVRLSNAYRRLDSAEECYGFALELAKSFEPNYKSQCIQEINAYLDEIRQARQKTQMDIVLTIKVGVFQLTGLMQGRPGFATCAPNRFFAIFPDLFNMHSLKPKFCANMQA